MGVSGPAQPSHMRFNRVSVAALHSAPALAALHALPNSPKNPSCTGRDATILRAMGVPACESIAIAEATRAVSACSVGAKRRSNRLGIGGQGFEPQHLDGHPCPGQGVERVDGLAEYGSHGRGRLQEHAVA